MALHCTSAACGLTVMQQPACLCCACLIRTLLSNVPMISFAIHKQLVNSFPNIQHGECPRALK